MSDLIQWANDILCFITDVVSDQVGQSPIIRFDATNPFRLL
jgi:hypothetical protein